MRYVMKQKLFCWGDDFTIKDEAGTDRFFVVEGQGRCLCWFLGFHYAGPEHGSGSP